MLRPQNRSDRNASGDCGNGSEPERRCFPLRLTQLFKNFGVVPEFYCPSAFFKNLSRHDVFCEALRFDRLGNEAVIAPGSHFAAETTFLVFTHRGQAGHAVCAA